MGQDLTMMVGFSLVNKFITDQLKDEFPPELDADGREKTNYALEVLSGGASFLFMSAMMEIIIYEEKFVQYLFAAGEALIFVLYARNKDWILSAASRIIGSRGVKAMSRMKVFNSQNDPTNSFVGQVHQAMSNIMQGRAAGTNAVQTIDASNNAQQTAVIREGHDLKFASLNNKSFTDSIMLKMFSGTFTQSDEIILKQVIGRTNFKDIPINIDEMNKIHEFMVIKDSNGKFVGLTKAFTDLVNGIGFIK